MHTIHRRSFIKKTSFGLGAAFVLSQLPKELLAAAAVNDMPLSLIHI